MSRYPVYALSTTNLVVPGSKFRQSVERRRLYWSDDAVVLAHPDLFTREDPALLHLAGWTASPDVEQATAAPGEKRSTRRVG